MKPRLLQRLTIFSMRVSVVAGLDMMVEVKGEKVGRLEGGTK
jgi:hypothetical protein